MKIKIKDFVDNVTKFIENGGIIPDDLTFQGEKLEAVVTKFQKVLRIELSNGEILLPSENHPFMINNEEVLAKDIDVGTVLHNNISIVSSKYISEGTRPVYDIEISTNNNIYELGGVLHHNTRVMNSIRSLMLEKKVNANFSIPEDMMLVTAMNPTDDGTEELSDHLADVMDIIDVEIKETELFKYLRTKDENLQANKDIGFDITAKVANMFRELIGKIESDKDSEGEPIKGNSKKWYWQWDNNVIYVSPREIDNMVSGSIGLVVTELLDFEDFDKTENYSDDEYLGFIDTIRETIITKTCSLLSFIGEDKHAIEPFAMQGLYDFIKFQFESEDFDDIMGTQSENIVSIKSMVEDSAFDFDAMLEYDEIGDMIENYAESVEAEELVGNVSDIIDIITNDYSASPTEFISNIVSFYKVLDTCDWSQYSGKLSANMTEALLQRGFRPYAKSLLQQAIDNNQNFTSEVDNHEYVNILKDLSGRKNYFK